MQFPEEIQAALAILKQFWIEDDWGNDEKTEEMYALGTKVGDYLLAQGLVPDTNSMDEIEGHLYSLVPAECYYFVAVHYNNLCVMRRFKEFKKRRGLV